MLWRDLGMTEALSYRALRRLLEQHYCNAKQGEVIGEAYYFTAEDDVAAASQNPFFAALQYAPPTGPGLQVRLYWLQRRELKWPLHMGGGPVLHPQTGEQFIQTQQKAVDVGLVFTLMQSFSNHGWNKLFLAAGDGDFHEPIQHLVRNHGVELILLGGRDTISSQLLDHARHVVYLEDIAHSVGIARPPKL